MYNNQFCYFQISDQNKECLELLQLPPDRIGHGTFLYPSHGGTEEIMKVLEKNATPFGKYMYSSSHLISSRSEFVKYILLLDCVL